MTSEIACFFWYVVGSQAAIHDMIAWFRFAPICLRRAAFIRMLQHSWGGPVSISSAQYLYNTCITRLFLDMTAYCRLTVVPIPLAIPYLSCKSNVVLCKQSVDNDDEGDKVITQ